MSDKMPERIWACRWGIEWIWDDEGIDDTDTEYIRADLVAAKDAEIARLREAGREMFRGMKEQDPLDRVFSSVAWRELDPDA